ncbi:MAG: tetratricopeptide repeat protein [Pyrinomonadaceae bacterium]
MAFNIAAKDQVVFIGDRPDSGEDRQTKIDERTAPKASLLSRASSLSWASVSVTEGRVLFLIVAAIILVFTNTLQYPFIHDDVFVIVGNPQIRSWNNLIHAFTTDVWNFRTQLGTQLPMPPYYRPMHTIYMTVNYKIFGLWAQGWHITNITVHVLVVLAAYYLVRRLSGRWQVAALTAVLFGMHPARVESVAWISGVTDPLMALFFLLGMIFYILYREETRRRWLVASVVCYALAGLSKEAGLTLPLLIVAWEVFRAYPSWKESWKEFRGFVWGLTVRLVPYGIVGALYLNARFFVLGSIAGTGKGAPRAWMSLPYIFTDYLLNQLVPVKLSLTYNTTFVTSLADRRIWLPCLLLLLAAAAMWVWRRHVNAQTGMALALIFVPLLPALNVGIFGEGYLLQDRYFYISAIGFCWLASNLILAAAKLRPSLVTALTCIAIVALGAATVQQNHIWSDSRLLWERGVERAPDLAGTYDQLGIAYGQHDDYAASREAFLKSLKLEKEDKNRAKTYCNLAVALNFLGQFDEAVAALERALEISPRMLDAHNNLGNFYMEHGDYDKALAQLQRALEIEPRYVRARANMAQAKALLGDHKGAAQEYERVLAQQPEDRLVRYKLSLSYTSLKEYAKAIEHLERLAATEPDPTIAESLRDRVVQLRALQAEQQEN